MENLVGKRYAEALFEVALEMNRLEDFKTEISSVTKVFKDEPQLKTVFEHPKLSKAEKKDIVNAIFKDRVSQEIVNLIYIMIDKGRERYIEDISREYAVLSNKAQGIIEGKVYTAVSMDSMEKEKLQNKLSQNLNKRVILKNVIDPSLIGGVLVRLEDRVIDASIKGQLEDIKKNLNNLRITIG